MSLGCAAYTAQGYEQAEKNGQIAIREYLCIRLSLNHTIIDGAPAARFCARLKELIESGYSLSECGDALIPPLLPAFN